MNLWRRLPWPTWVSIAALLALLTFINSILTPDHSLEVSNTSYGHAPAGYGAVYDLLHELGLEPQRSRTLYPYVEQTRPLWLLTPNFLATTGTGSRDDVGDLGDAVDASADPADAADPADVRDAGDAGEAGDAGDVAHMSNASEVADGSDGRKRQRSWRGARAEPLVESLRAWIERGGTAIVFGNDRTAWGPLGLQLDTCEAPNGAEATGSLSTQARALGGEDELVLFDLATDDQRADGQEADAELPAPNVVSRVGGGALIVEQRVGAGRLVAVSDARLLTNRNLDKADNAILAVDLIRTYGLPRIDERCHGLLSEVSVFSALGTGRAALLFVTLGGFGLLLLWQRRATPARTLAPVSELDASLARFVDSLSLLYFRRAPRHENEVFTAYHHGFRHRLRRLLFGRGSADDRLLTQRIRRDLADDAVTLAAVEGRSIPNNAHQLRDAVRALERYGASLVRTTHARRSR